MRFLYGNYREKPWAKKACDSCREGNGYAILPVDEHNILSWSTQMHGAVVLALRAVDSMKQLRVESDVPACSIAAPTGYGASSDPTTPSCCANC